MGELPKNRIPASDMAIGRIRPWGKAVQIPIGNGRHAPIIFAARHGLKHDQLKIPRLEFLAQQGGHLLSPLSHLRLLGRIKQHLGFRRRKNRFKLFNQIQCLGLMSFQGLRLTVNLRKISIYPMKMVIMGFIPY